MRTEDLAHYTALEELQMRIADCAETIAHLHHKYKRALYNDFFYDADQYEAQMLEEQEKIKQLERSYELLKSQR